MSFVRSIDRVAPLSKRVGAVLFDLDGTLVHTAPDIAEAVNRTLSELQLVPLSLDLITNFVGKGSPVLIARVLRIAANKEPTKSSHSLALALFQEHYEQVCGSSATVFPGVLEGLDLLYRANIPLGVVTNKYQRFASRLLAEKGLADYFGVVVGGDLLDQRKPDPAPVLHAATALQAAIENTVFIGDSLNDTQAARAAGCYRMICVPYGYNEGRPTESLDCDLLVDSVFAAAELITRSSTLTRRRSIL